MAGAILHRWPHLCDTLSHADALYLWKSHLRSVFKNLRRSVKTDKEVLAIKAKFGKRKNEDELQVDVVKKKDVWGVPNFLPSREAGEDDHSIEHHINRLKDQATMNVAKRNKEIINISLQKTYPERRKMLILEMRRIGDIMDIFPILSEGQEAS